MTNLDTKLAEIKARAEAVDCAWGKVPMIDDKLKSVSDFVTPLIGVVNEAVPAIRQDIPALLRLVDVLRAQRNEWIEHIDLLMNTYRMKDRIESQNQAALEAVEGESK